MRNDQWIGYAVLGGMGAAIGISGVALYDALTTRARQQEAGARYTTYLSTHPEAQRYIDLASKTARGNEEEEEFEELGKLRTNPEVIESKRLRQEAYAIEMVPSWRLYGIASGSGTLAGIALFAGILAHERRRAQSNIQVTEKHRNP